MGWTGKIQDTMTQPITTVPDKLGFYKYDKDLNLNLLSKNSSVTSVLLTTGDLSILTMQMVLLILLILLMVRNLMIMRDMSKKLEKNLKESLN